MIAFLLRNRWAQVAIILALVVSCVWFGVSALQNSGRAIERAEQKVGVAKSETRAAVANRELSEDGTRRLDSYVERQRHVERSISQAQEEIANAQDLAAIDSAYRASVLRLRDDAKRARAKAVDEYNSSLVP
jgi:hypothetical protein